MFYVSTISGTQVPFDPQTTPISNLVQQVATLAEINGSEATAEVVPTTSLIESSAVSLLTSNTSSEQVSEDAAVYERAALATPQSHISADASTLGRAGALMAYTSHVSESNPGERESDGQGIVSALEGVRSFPPDSAESRTWVNPIRRRKYSAQTPLKERKQVVTAQDIMSTPVFTLFEHQVLAFAVRAFKEHQFRHIPIVSEASKLVGIISDRDFIGATSKNEFESAIIKNRMITNILTARPEAKIAAVAEVMITHRIGCLPIVNSDELLVGMLTRSDILRAIVNHAPIELWT